MDGINGESLLSGVVAWFSRERMFGFLSLDGSSQQYFFHFSRGRVAWANMYGFAEMKQTRFPEVGGRVLFTLIEGKKGKQAGVWFFELDYLQVRTQFEETHWFRIVNVNAHDEVVWMGRDEKNLERQFVEYCGRLDNLQFPENLRFEKMNPLGDWVLWGDQAKRLPGMPRFRVVKITTFHIGNRQKHKRVMWLGVNDHDLNQKYPRVRGDDDPLANQVFKEYTIEYRFERLSALGGDWEMCLDPRPMPLKPLPGKNRRQLSFTR